ncbi:transposable element Tcb1 transposase [Trichonephila clavipes]|nr:transposable element Tcb1 transposase [Trichonephila clavipes]
MYGSTCADMQVDVMGECLSSIKHVVGVRSVFLAEIARRIAVKITPSCFLSENWRIINLLDDIWMLLPEVESLGSWRKPQCDKCGCRVRNCSQHRFMTLETISNYRNSYPGSVVVVHEEPHPQMTGTLSYRPEETGGRQREKSLDTRHRRLDDRYRVLPWPEDCTVVVCLHDACLYDESRFSLSSDSHRILIWRERGSRNHPSNIIERERYGGRGVLVWGGIMPGSRTDLHIFDAGSVNGTRYCNEILLPYVRLFKGAMGL